MAFRRRRLPHAAPAFVLSPEMARTGAGPLTPSCGHALGRMLMHACHNRAPLAQLPLLPCTDVLLEAVAVAKRSPATPATPTPDIGPAVAIDRAGLTFPQALLLVTSQLQHLANTNDLRDRTVAKIAAEMASLTLFMTDGQRAPLLADVTAADVRYWINSPIPGQRHHGQAPSAATRRLRRSAARSFFRILRTLGLFTGDPTADIHIPAAKGTTYRPLTRKELQDLRIWAVIDGGETRLGATLALAEATATSGELPGVLISHCHLDEARVWLDGITNRLPRWGYLTEWGVSALRERIAILTEAGAGPEAPLIYAGSTPGESPQASACAAMHDLLAAAGLTDDPAIKPTSISTAFGLIVWKQEHDIALVAQVLGCRSLDRAAKLIGVDLPTACTDVDERAQRCVPADRSPAGTAVHRRGRRSCEPDPDAPAPTVAKKKTKKIKAVPAVGVRLQRVQS